MTRIPAAICHQCGNSLVNDVLDEAGFKRCFTHLCWVCAHLKKAVARDAAIEAKTWATPVDA